MKILNLTVSKKWFDMIFSGEKKEEYRELKPYWTVRLVDLGKTISFSSHVEYKKFDAVRFFNGCALSQKFPNFLIKLESISIGKQKPQWGCMDLDKNVFVLKLGEKILQ